MSAIRLALPQPPACGPHQEPDVRCQHLPDACCTTMQRHMATMLRSSGSATMWRDQTAHISVANLPASDSYAARRGQRPSPWHGAGLHAADHALAGRRENFSRVRTRRGNITRSSPQRPSSRSPGGSSYPSASRFFHHEPPTGPCMPPVSKFRRNYSGY